MTADETLALADAMFSSIERGDLATLRTLYADDILTWGNFDQKSSDIETSMKTLGWLCRKLPDLHYEVTRREVLADGFLQEHVLCGTAPDGTAIAMPACLVATVTDGRISHINEYLDPAALAPLTNRA